MNLNIKSVWNKPYRKKNKNGLISLVKLSAQNVENLNKKEKKNDLHIVYLLDNSGSMGLPIKNTYQSALNVDHFFNQQNLYNARALNVELPNRSITKLQQVKNAVIESIKLLSSNDVFSIIKFSSNATCIFESQKATPENKATAIRQIESVYVEGDTQMYKGFDAGINELEKFKDKNLTKRLFLLTDGEATDRVAYDVFYDIAKSVSNKDSSPITISTFGVGDRFNEEFLLELSLSGSGSFYFLDADVSFTEVFLREVGELQSLLTRNLKFSINSSEMSNVELMNTFKKDEDGDYILPNIINGRDVSFAIKCNAIGKSSKLKLVFKYKDNNNVQHIEMVDVNVDINEENYINKEVEDFALQIEIAKKQKEASEMIRKGDKMSAQTALNGALSMTRQLNVNSLEATENVNKVLQSINSGDLNIAAKSSLSASYETFYSRK